MNDQDAELPRKIKGNVALLREGARAPVEVSSRTEPWTPTAAAPPPRMADGMVRDLGGLLKYRSTILAAWAVCFAFGAVITLLTQPIYTARTTLQLDREAEKVVSRDDATPMDNYGEEFFQTQYGLLKSRALAERVGQSLGLNADNSFLKALAGGGSGPSLVKMTAQERQQAVADRLHGGLSVVPVRGSRLVNVTFSSPDPALSAKVANAFADNFIAAAIDRRFESSSYARDFLEKRLAEVKTKLEQSERDLVAYAARQQIIQLSDKSSSTATDSGQSLPAANLQAFSTALAAAKTDRIRAEQKWRVAAGASGVGLPDILQSPTIQELSQQRAKMKADYQDRLSIYKPDYPDMRQLKARIDETERQITVEAGNIRQSIKVQYLAALDNERALEGQVNGLKSSVLDLRGRSIRYTILQREVDTNRTLYDGLLQRYKEVGVAGGVSSNNISIIDRAEAPRRPSSPRPLINLLLASLIGAGLGGALAFIRAAFDQAVRTPADVEALGLSMLGTAPTLKKGAQALEALADVRSPLAESYQSLRSALQFATADGFPATLLVTSPWQGEGKSITAFAVAKFVARLGFRVLLMDADLRKPSLHTMLGADNTVGLTNILTGGAVLTDAIVPTVIDNMFAVTAGPASPNPAELLSGPRLKLTVAEAESLFDMVIFDGPPVMSLADAPLIGDAVAATLFVIQAGRTTRPQVRSTLARLNMAGVHVIGALLTRYSPADATVGNIYGYGYGYDYGQGAVAITKAGGGAPGLVARARRMISR